MARLLDDASSQYLETANALVSSTPCSYSVWFNTDQNYPPSQTILEIGESGTTDVLGMWITSSNNLIAKHDDGLGGNSARTTTGYTINTWHHAMAVFSSESDREVWLDDGGYDQETTTQNANTGMDTTSLGVAHYSPDTGFFSGMLAEAGVWNVALTSSEVSVLAAGHSPLLVRPQSLVAYWPLIGRMSPEIDLVGGFDLTLTASPTTADHPPTIYYPVPDLSYVRPLSLEGNRASTNWSAFDRWVSNRVGFNSVVKGS